jgi:hypothetical protein
MKNELDVDFMFRCVGNFKPSDIGDSIGDNIANQCAAAEKS